MTYIGPGGLKFAQTLAEMGAQVRVPTTLNSGSTDRERWREQVVCVTAEPQQLNTAAEHTAELS